MRFPTYDKKKYHYRRSVLIESTVSIDYSAEYLLYNRKKAVIAVTQ
ncbi:hypothetical protein A9A89_0418 [Bifidobacterium psychraerophilum DSM 22366]|jgi:hypothetical protein|uniref:Uncharacterized protein n=1 Tax=Bifidobacterium aquikefiri TaxID=1653207 RepID=A0A261G0Z2_9BIFI|nr:hypothetical protein BAQU_1957 [Bifidobacterium aquikefiri]PKA94235.1 hypothetical protein A9A89_0418 [Bifidobacterium psychraerophilum DSM 22366]